MILGRKEVLIAGVAAFIAWGLAVQWLPILRFIGYAFLLGIFLTVLLTTTALLLVSRPKDRRKPHSSRPAFLAEDKWENETATFTASRAYVPTTLYEKSFVVAQALDALLSLVLRDFITSWYGNITKTPTFTYAIDKNVRIALTQLRDRTSQEDIVGVTVSRIIPIITAHLKEFDRAERVVRGKSLNRNVTESEELDLAIAAKYKEGKLHPAASLAFSDAKAIQQEYLRKILVRLLPHLLPESVLNSRAVLVLIKEIVSCAVLFPVTQLLADPDTWNQIVEAYGRTALQDRKTVRRMRAALDQHASPSPKSKTAQLPRLSPNDSERAFERFVRAIRKTKTLSDARKFRSQVASQLKRETLVEGQDPVYLRRLEMAKRVLDQKVAKLAMIGSSPSMGQGPPDVQNGIIAKAGELSLVEIMHTSSGLSYFMEYMDRQGKMTLVQFWVVVDGFRNPLEDDFGDETVSQVWTDTDRTDIAQINEAYMSTPELKVPQEDRDATRAFLVANREATVEQYRAARIAILSAQSAVFEELESRHLPNFRKSDLYFKFLASDDVAKNGLQDARQIPPLRTSKSLAQAPAMVRSGSAPFLRGQDLRRAAMSSSDVRSLASSKLVEHLDPSRKSFDTDASAPLFDDGYDTDPLAHSTQSLGHDSMNGDQPEQRQIIENMEAAMNNIMTESPHDETFDDSHDAIFASPTSSRKSIKSMDSTRSSLDMLKIESVLDKPKPSLATLGLVNTSSRIGVFSDNDLFPDEEKFIEDEYAEEAEDPKDLPDEEIHEAAPGDLGLAEAITGLTDDIERLVSQEAVVDTLTRKAELTNNIAELRILGKSRSSLRREIRRKELQRQQYIVQESDNSLYGKSSIRIKSVMVGKDDDGREFALYVIEVQRQAGDQMPAANWAVARRYSEFHDLYQRLGRRYPSTRTLEFPRRRVVMKLQKQFLHNRRVVLENYLQQLLRMPDVCQSRELRSFLSQQAILSHNPASSASDAQDIVTRIYNSVTDGMDDFLGNIAVLDQLSVAGQNLISAATTQLGMAQNEVVSFEPGSMAEAEAELQAFEDKELEPFVKPICDIFLETFELTRGNNWLRGRAVIVVLHQLLGGTVERKVRDTFKVFTNEDSILKSIEFVKDTMWPDGKLREAQVRALPEKAKTRKEAAAVLSTLIPDLAASVVGRANAQAASRRISATINNARLNQHLVFTILDEMVSILFEEPKKSGIT